MAEPLSAELSHQWRRFARVMRARIWTILTFLTITVLVVTAGTWLQLPIYRATATVLIDLESPNVLAVSRIEDKPTLGETNYWTYADYYKTQATIVTSRGIAGRVFANLTLHEQPWYVRPPSALARLFGYVKADPIARLLKQVKVEPVRQTRLLKIHVEDRSPQQAAQIANEFAVLLAEENLAKAMAAETLTLMKNEYLKLQSKEAELSKRYLPKHPSMVRTRQEMKELTQAIEQEMKWQLHYDDERLQTEDGVPVQKPSRSLVERLKDSSTIGSLRPNNIRVQDPAQIPVRPVKPNKALNLLLALSLGLIGGVGVATALELLDSSVKMPEDVEQDERLVLLGSVPRIDGFNGFHANAARTAQSRYQCVQVAPLCPSAESYRALRTSLLYAAPEGTARAVVVTSPGAEEGKSTTVTNLGIALAQGGLKVLVVDADLRKGLLHEAFQLKPSPGLSEFLVGQTSFEPVVQATGISGLSIVTCGAYPPNPAELLGSPGMREFLTRATSTFDRVLLDSPPVIAVTDGAVLAAVTGAVIAVAHSGKTPRQALYRLTALCQEVRANMLGVVLNNVSGRDASAYYRYAAYRYVSRDRDQSRHLG